jgi:hypothetical protein
MTNQYTFILVDAAGWETNSYKKAVKAILYVGSKKLDTISLNYSDTKKEKFEAIEIRFTNYEFERDVLRMEKEEEKERKKQIREKEKARLQAIREKEKARLQAIREKEKAKLQKLREKEKARLQKINEKEKARIKKIRDEEKRLEREWQLKQEEENRIKTQQRELSSLIREDLRKLLKEDEEDAALVSKTPKKHELYYDEELERQRIARKALEKDKHRLKRTINGRIRLYLKEHLIDKLQIWDDPEKEEDFVKILETMYGQSIKSLKDRADETNFKKFITRVTNILDSHDARVKPTEEMILRAWMKRVQWEEETQAKEKDVLFEREDLTYKLIDEKIKYYYQKSTGTNRAVRQFIYDFDKQFELTQTSEAVLREVYPMLKITVYQEIEKLFRQGNLKLGKQFQVRMLIPQYDKQDELVHLYIGGNGQTKERTGYGISISSVKFNFKELDNYVYQLMNLMEKRLASYLARNSEHIERQFVSGFMIIGEI